MNIIADHFYSSRGAGHTRLLAASIANHLANTAEPIMVFLGSMRESRDILQLVRTHLDAELGSRAPSDEELRHRLVFVSLHDSCSKTVGRRWPALVDNGAVMDLTEKYQRQIGAMADSLDERDRKIRKLEADLANTEERNHALQCQVFKALPLKIAAQNYRDAFWEQQRHPLKAHNALTDLARLARGKAPDGLNEPED